MDSEQQITLWSQRLLRSKLHLGGNAADKPLCDRQLNNHRGARAQLADRLEFALSQGEFTYQLLSGRACRHCAIKAGLLVRTVPRREQDWTEQEIAHGDSESWDEENEQ